MGRNWLAVTVIAGCFWTIAGANPILAQVLEKVELEASSYADLDLWCECNRTPLIESINHSLTYLDTAKSAEDYANLDLPPKFSRDNVRRSLLRFRELVQASNDPHKLQQQIQQEFDFYQSVGTDSLGTVDFTAYFEPSYQASPVQTEKFRYPIYRQPPTFDQWQSPHPTRAELEGANGLAPADSPLRGQELVWLPSRLEAYLVQVQGSARLQLPNGKIMTVGFDGSTDYGYVSLGKELINDEIFLPEELSLPKLIDYFETNPDKLSEYIPRNNRFIFFRETFGSPPIGSLNVPVTAHRSIATDKSLMPPGAIALVSTVLPFPAYNGEWFKLDRTFYALDQDTGSAIKGAGRVDIFLGTGTNVQTEAGLVNDQGQLYYLLLK
ncbi:MltA domain protein [[Leptolyngbya] sp. PCC 7376]|uniref:murein transglycosylase A n=1 Tax=[Leptolyngbya] sp. PCC 7376 TaxID=111781 RepID=UPI00029ED8CE|nr:MltA domain-containing protein [[Leptolyngbya] sp. PCC 7376]AFY38035.1 MltA domain protein [[Leptolyngbya] sp. PCC 7376]